MCLSAFVANLSDSSGLGIRPIEYPALRELEIVALSIAIAWSNEKLKFVNVVIDVNGCLITYGNIFYWSTCSLDFLTKFS